MFAILFNIVGCSVIGLSTWLGLRLLRLGYLIQQQYRPEIRFGRWGNWPRHERIRLQERYPEDVRIVRFNRLKTLSNRIFFGGILLLVLIAAVNGSIERRQATNGGDSPKTTHQNAR